MEKMKAFLWEGNGVYGLQDVDKPVLIEPTDVIGRVTVNTICTSDIHIIRLTNPSVTCPNILGHEFCVEVVEAGSEVKNFKVGDHALSSPAASCGECPACLSGDTMGCEHGGAFGLNVLAGAQAEYVRIPLADKTLYKIPDGFKDEDFVLVGDMYSTAYFGIQNANIQEGQTVVVMGLGPVGFCACELLKKICKANVIAITRKESSLAIARENGIADYTINGLDPDMVDKVIAYTGGAGADAVIETIGNADSMNNSMAMLKREGILSTVAVFSGPITLEIRKYYGKNITIKMGTQECAGIEDMMGWVQEGRLNPGYMFTHRAPLNEIMHAYDVFGKKPDGCIKWLITPYEHDKD